MATRTRAKRSRRVVAAQQYSSTLRTSERSAQNRCRQRWHWGYNEVLRPKREAPALRFGTLIHKALELYYAPKNQSRRKPILPSDIFAKLFDEELKVTMEEWVKWRDEDDEWHTYRELGMVMLDGYLEHFKERDKEYIVLLLEQRFYTPILIPRGKEPLAPPSPVQYVGTIDRILYHLPTKLLMFGDYKTTKNDPTKVGHLALDEQAGAYWAYGPTWLAQEAPDSVRQQMQAAVAHLPRAHRRAVENFRFDGIIYDFLKKALPDDRPVNKDGYAMNLDGTVSKRQPGPLFHREPVYRDAADRQNVLTRIYEDAKEIGQMRRGELAIKKSPDKFICIGCQFIDMCELHESGADWMAYRDAMYEDWQPYDTYEIDADELE